MGYTRISGTKGTLPLMITQDADVPDTAAPEYHSLNGETYGSEGSRKNIMPCSGTFKGFEVAISNAAGAAKSWTITLRVEGVDTAITTTISGASDKTGSDRTNSVHVTRGQDISVGFTPAGNPAAMNARWSIGFTPD